MSKYAYIMFPVKDLSEMDDFLAKYKLPNKFQLQ